MGVVVTLVRMESEQKGKGPWHQQQKFAAARAQTWDVGAYAQLHLKQT